ncbi:MAG TPA: helix-turn-helix domain-containing protein [Actinomycetes bacterium]|nr:helix-turn-helix domain-containing protein [Actinomycetes bacterium]
MRHATFRFALAPSSGQAAVLARHAGASRFAYNQSLRLVMDALAARQTDPSATVPWSGFDLINAPFGRRSPPWRLPEPRTAKQAAGLLMPLEGKALAIASAVVKPAPVKGEPTLRHPLGSRTPEKGGV